MPPIEIPAFTWENWHPQEPDQGPPLPEFLNIYWPWYKPEVPPGAQFKVSNLVISPTKVNPGQPVSVSCTVTNIGSQAGTKTIECRLEGTKMSEQTVTLNPGESKVVSFEVTPTVAKTYQVAVDGLTGSFIATTVPVADIRVENLAISPAQVNVGQKVTISVTAKNYGAVAGSKTIMCNVT